MTRSMVNFLLDLTMLVVFLALLWTDAVLFFVFPSPLVAQDWLLWGMDYRYWQLTNGILLATFAVLILIHLILHWNWVCGFLATRMSKATGRTIRVDSGINTLYGVALMIGCLITLGFLLMVAAVTVQEGNLPPATEAAQPHP